MTTTNREDKILLLTTFSLQHKRKSMMLKQYLWHKIPLFFSTNITALQLCQPILTNPYYHPFPYNQMANFQSHADVPPEPHSINSSISLNLSPGNSRHQSQFVTSSQGSSTLTSDSHSQDSLDPLAAVLSDNSSEHHSEHHLPTRTCKSQVF